jgi:hypothetical protein
MTKKLFKWMMAFAIVASPMVFTACGDDEDNNNGSSSGGGQGQKEQIVYSFSHYLVTGADSVGFKTALATVKTTMFTAMYSSVGQTYDPTKASSDLAIIIDAADEAKVLNILDATYAQIKDTDMKGGFYRLTMRENETTVKIFAFGKDPSENRVNIGFEDQALNAQNFWIGDSAGVYTYKESGVTVTATQGSYNGITFWSGFAISGRTENTYENLTPDQYNSVYGGTIYGNKFLVVQGSYNPDVECITFDKPTKVRGMYCTNSAYAYSSMTKGDDFAGGPFTKDDWFSAYITCLGERGDTISVTEVELAKKDVEGKDKIVDYWKTVRVNAENVKKITFSFDGSRKGEWGLNTPAYMCVDKIVLERQ